MKTLKKLDSINKKIALLNSEKLDIEKQIAHFISEQITHLLIKKHATDINIKEFIKKVSVIIDELKVNKKNL